MKDDISDEGWYHITSQANLMRCCEGITFVIKPFCFYMLMFSSRPNLCKRKKRRAENKKDEIEKLHTIISSEASASAPAPETVATNAVWDGPRGFSDVIYVAWVAISSSFHHWRFPFSLPVIFYLGGNQSHSFAHSHLYRQKTHTHTHTHTHKPQTPDF